MGKEAAYLDKAKEWIVINGADFIVNVVVFLIILIIGKIIISSICSVTLKALQKSQNVNDMLRGFVINILGKVLWAIVLMIGLQRLGIDIAPLIAGLGVVGFIIGFAFQDSLGNLASGVMIALNQPFKVGEFVDAGGITGSVRELNMMATTLTTPDNKKVIIPNSQVWGSAITNFTALDTRRIDMTVGISYNADIGKAKRIITEVIQGIEGIMAEPEPVIEVVEMADSSVNLAVRPWSKTADYWTIYFKAQQAIKEALDKEKIEIPFPQMDIHHHGFPVPSSS